MIRPFIRKGAEKVNNDPELKLLVEVGEYVGLLAEQNRTKSCVADSKSLEKNRTQLVEWLLKKPDLGEEFIQCKAIENSERCGELVFNKYKRILNSTLNKDPNLLAVLPLVDANKSNPRGSAWDSGFGHADNLISASVIEEQSRVNDRWKVLWKNGLIERGNYGVKYFGEPELCYGKALSSLNVSGANLLKSAMDRQAICKEIVALGNDLVQRINSVSAQEAKKVNLETPSPTAK